MEANVTLAIHRILIIDDNQDAADSLVALLNIQGSTARAAYSAAAGLEVLKDFKPEAVFLDLGMPEMDGYEAARRIRALPGGDSVKLIALTGWGKQQVGERVEAAGFDHHLTKPASYEVLCNLLWCKDKCAESAQTCLLLNSKGVASALPGSSSRPA